MAKRDNVAVEFISTFTASWSSVLEVVDPSPRQSDHHSKLSLSKTIIVFVYLSEWVNLHVAWVTSKDGGLVSLHCVLTPQVYGQ